MSVQFAPSRETMRTLASVAQGLEPADAVLVGGGLVDVYTEDVIDGWGIAVAAGRIAYIGTDARKRVGPETRVYELDGDLAAPGLIDGHTHLKRVSLRELAVRSLRAGVTTSVVDPAAIAYICGPPGLRELLAEAPSLPSRVLLMIPPAIGFDWQHEQRLGPIDEWAALLEQPGVAGVGELYWANILRGQPRAETLAARAIELGLSAEGHAAGARSAALAALTAFGIDADHESVTKDDLVLRLRLGLHAEIRHDVDQEGAGLLAELSDRADLSRLELVTDGVEASALDRERCLNAVVERAVVEGLTLPRAIRLASRNVAERFGFGRWLGGIAPGMLADLLIVPRDGTLRPRLVLVEGCEPKPCATRAYPRWMRETVDVPSLGQAFFAHPGVGHWRAIGFRNQLVTDEVKTDGSDTVVLAAIDRLGGGAAFRGLLASFPVRGGAVALTSGWDTACVLAVGDNPPDMKAAVASVSRMQGGAVVISDGVVLAEWHAPLAGCLSLDSASQTAEAVASIDRALRELGSLTETPLRTLETLASPAIPHLRITATGYVRVRDGTRADLAWA